MVVVGDCGDGGDGGNGNYGGSSSSNSNSEHNSSARQRKTVTTLILSEKYHEFPLNSSTF